MRVRLSEKGLKLRDLVSQMFDRHVEALANTDLGEEGFQGLNDTLLRLERFWNGRTISSVPGRVANSRL